MRVRRFLISFGVALAFGAAWHFAACAAVERGIEQAAYGFGEVVGTITDLASALAGESPALRSSLPPVMSEYNWTTISVACGIIALSALYFSLHQLAALYDERA